MQKVKSCLLTIAVAIVAVVLVACGNPAEQGKKNFSGTWELESMDNRGQSYTAEDISALKQIGVSLLLTLNEDGSAQLDLFGTQVACKWTAKDANNATLNLQNTDGSAPSNQMSSVQNMKLEGDKITMESSDSSLTFKKSDGTTSQNSSSASSSVSGGDASSQKKQESTKKEEKSSSSKADAPAKSEEKTENAGQEENEEYSENEEEYE